MWYKEKVVRFYDLDGNLIEVRKPVRLEGKIQPASQRTSIPLTLHGSMAVATSSESPSQRARELRFRCAPSQSWLSPHQKESFQPLSNKFEQLKALFFSLARSLHEKFA